MFTSCPSRLEHIEVVPFDIAKLFLFTRILDLFFLPMVSRDTTWGFGGCRCAMSMVPVTLSL